MTSRENDLLSKQNIKDWLTSLSCSSSRATTEWSAIFAFGVYPSFELLVRERLVTILEHQDEAQGDKNTTEALILKEKQMKLRYCAISVYKNNSKTRPDLNFFYLPSKKKKWSTFCRRADKEFQSTATYTYALSISTPKASWRPCIG